MISNRPYLIRAFYDWISDNHLTPYIMVDAEFSGVNVPRQFVEEGKIVLNIAPQAIVRLSITNESLQFDASFSSIPYHIQVPIKAVLAIYAFENGRGMVFEEDEDNGGDDNEPPPPHKGIPAAGGKARPQLKIVK